MLELLRRLPAPVKVRLLQAVEKLGAWPHSIRTGPARGLVLVAPFSRRQYISGSHEPHVAEALSRRLDSGMVAIDAGAHMGYASLLMARRVGRTGSVFAFEPVARHARLLRRSAVRNRMAQVTVEERALGARVADAWMSVGSNDAMGRVIRDPVPGARPVSMTTIDAWAAGREALPRLDLVKLDVEGQELAVLAGGTRVLRQYRPDVVCEVHWSRNVRYRPRQLVDWLRAAGYAIELLDGDRETEDLDDVLRYTEAVEAPEGLVVFHIVATATT